MLVSATFRQFAQKLAYFTSHVLLIPATTLFMTALSTIILLQSSTANAQTTGVISGDATILTLLPEKTPVGSVFAINASGMSVGTAVAGNGWSAPVLWSPAGVPKELEVLHKRDAGVPITSAINSSGQTVGIVDLIGDSGGQPVLWSSSGALTKLKIPNGAYGFVVSINTSGESVGHYTADGDVGWTLVSWSSSGERTKLQLPRGAFGAQAVAINDAGQVVGNFANKSDGYQYQHGALWSSSDEPILLQDLDSKNPVSVVTAINSSGQSAGWSYGTDGLQHAVLWSSSGIATDLGVGQATCMNNAGQVAGIYSNSGGSVGVLWSPGQAPQYLRSAVNVTGINSSGEVVGSTVSHAGLWTNGEFVDLNNMIGTDWRYTNAIGINDAGMIVGIGTYKDSYYVPFIIADLSRYFYNTAYQNVTTTAAAGTYTINTPYVGQADHHSLAELALTDADTKQIVEVGWTVDPVLNGDSAPHLFVFHWVDHDGGQSCYPNRITPCGFVPNAQSTLQPGDSLASVSSPIQFQIAYQDDTWNIFVAGQLIGGFPGSLWKNQFTKAQTLQWFGEVSASSADPQTQMGNGIFGTQSGSAEVTSLSYLNSSGTTAGASPSFIDTNTNFYIHFFNADTKAFNYGGPGAQ